MTIKTTHLSIKKYDTINGILAPAVYITFPSFFKKVTHINAKTIIGYTFENNVLKLTIETDTKKKNTVRVNKNNSISISNSKCPLLNLLNIPKQSTLVKFTVRNNELILNLNAFASEVIYLNDNVKTKKNNLQPSFEYYNENKKAS